MIRDQQPTHGGWIRALVILGELMACLGLSAQDVSLEKQVANIQKAMARSNAAITEFTWQQQVTVTEKNNVRARQMFQVEVGADGRIQRIPLDLSEESSSTARTNQGMREWMSEKKERKLQLYTQELRELAETYSQAATDLLRSAYQRGDISSEPANSGALRLLIHNYVKSGDSATFVLDPKSSELQSLEVASYLEKTREPVLINARFSRSADLPNHIEETTILSSKQKLTITVRNLDYQRRPSEGPQMAGIL
ncbi:MAG TPA: hypothetical protein VJA94_10770 [Candidatus Angelobacter sp.]